MTPANILILGDTGTGKTAWLKEQVSAAEHNYVVLDLYGEFVPEYAALVESGYRVHAVCLSGEVTLYQETLRDLFYKGKQALFLSAPKEEYADAALAQACVRTIMNFALALPEEKQKVFCLIDDAFMLDEIPELSDELVAANRGGLYLEMSFQKLWQVRQMYGETLLSPEKFPSVVYTGGREHAVERWVTECYQPKPSPFPLTDQQMLICTKEGITVKAKEFTACRRRVS